MNSAFAALVLVLTSSSLDAAVLYGRVLDAGQRPVVGATVVLGEGLATHTDAEGKYRFENLAAKAYSLRVEKAGFSQTSAGPFALTPGENKNVAITLSIAAPEFFDEPKFVVAGVTAGGYQGGHGSDVVLRSAESLAKATDGLRAESKLPPSNEEADRQHRLASDDESSGKYVDAVREYQRAAELDPSEPNLFDWGEELLKHHADGQAIEIFAKANSKYPDSVRILLGLATAHYGIGAYDQAAKYFFAASDVDPSDPRPYAFLGEIQSPAITQTTGFVERMRRFATLHPDNARAQYLYAMSLWSQRKNADDSETAMHARKLLERAIQLDPWLGPAYLLLGTMDSDTNNLERAVEVDPTLEEAHYRLAQIYRQKGLTAAAQKELATYERLRKQSAEQTTQERNQLQQFVFELRQ